MLLRLLRYVLVAVLVSSLAVDCALARRLFKRDNCRPKCPCSCPASAEADCAIPPIEQVPYPSIDDCECAAAEVVEFVPECQDCIDSVPAVAQPVDQPIYMSPVEQPTVVASETNDIAANDDIAQPEPERAMANSPAPSQLTTFPPAPLAVPAASVEVPESTPEPAIESTVEPQPQDAIVGDRYSEFDVTPAPASTAETLLPEPPVNSNQTSDDVFGEPDAVPAQAEPAEVEDALPTPNAPASEPPSAEPDDDFEDLFGSTTANPSYEEEEEEPTDTFSSVPAETLADTPVEPEPAAPEPAVPEPVNPEPTEPESTAPDSMEPVEEADEPESYDPFGEDLLGIRAQLQILAVSGGLRSETYRTWTDDTARFECQARLVRATAQGVVIQRSMGEKLVVPFSRLGSNDLQFVRSQISALRIVSAQDQAAQKLAVAWGR